MSFQIATIAVFNDAGDERRVDLSVGAVNVVTGASKTGKSSLLDIIDYCLGSKSCSIAAGTIRETVAVYALRLVNQQGASLTAARHRPKLGKETTTNMFVGVIDWDEAVDLENLTPNVSREQGVRLLSTFSGIGDTETRVKSSLRSNYVPTIRQALFLCLQGQSEVANRDLLFHSQGDEWVPQAIRDTLPYFLGALDDDTIGMQARLRELRREAHRLQRELEEVAGLQRVTRRGHALYDQAVEVGLVAPSEESTDSNAVMQALVAALEDPDPTAEALRPDDDTYNRLLLRRDELGRQLDEAQAQHLLLRQISGDRTGYLSELAIQTDRLAPAGDMSVDTGPDSASATCPVCASTVADLLPTVAGLQSAHAELRDQLAGLEANSPRLQSDLERTRMRVDEVRTEIADVDRSIEQLAATREELRTYRDQLVRQAVVRGRIGLFVDAVPEAVGTSDADIRLRTVRDEIDGLEAQLSSEDVDAKMDSLVSRINDRIRAYAQKLQLEHSAGPVRLDLNALTVVADTPVGRRTLSQIGSAENALGYHLSVMLALHEFFATHDRPVPRLLVLDQPSQVYFPADGAESDEDREALVRMLDPVHVLAEELAPEWQVLILDHADLREPDWYPEAVRARWRNGEALVPRSWIAGQ